ncbi:MAG: sigma-70 family RNA polymerase sigma factor, partial [Acidimicrobiaceae bacterium]|nr:sigma-70 family RNA polymerase sigma factor [Acidimicrobiaceae bacterium]
MLRLHHDRIHAICRRLAGNDADGQDATQEALIAIVRGLPRFHGKAKFSTWAYRVATNAALDELRRRGRRPVPTVIEASDRFAGT